MDEESWMRKHGEGIIEEESRRRKHGGGITEDSWRRHDGAGNMEEESYCGAAWRGATGSMEGEQGGGLTSKMQ